MGNAFLSLFSLFAPAHVAERGPPLSASPSVAFRLFSAVKENNLSCLSSSLPSRTSLHPRYQTSQVLLRDPTSPVPSVPGTFTLGSYRKLPPEARRSLRVSSHSFVCYLLPLLIEVRYGYRVSAPLAASPTPISLISKFTIRSGSYFIIDFHQTSPRGFAPVS